MAQIDEKQRRTAEWLADQVAKTDPNRYALWNLWGSVGSGKSSVLRLVAKSLFDRGFVAIIVAAPGGEVDAAPIALMSTASQLKSANLLNGELAKLTNPQATMDREVGVADEGGGEELRQSRVALR